MEFATATVRSGAPPARARARAPSALGLVYGGARGPCRVVGAGPAAARARRRALVAISSHHQEHLKPLPSRAQEGGAVAVATQANELKVHGNDAAAADSETLSSQLGKTVRVRFVLNKQCSSGQSVCLVGDDPALGLWDPSNAFALKWAEESHDWILEKDLPANKLIEFKFLLQDPTGKLHWQDGPNRSFQTGETANTLVVFEDWDDVRNQKIAEEEGLASSGIEETVVSNDSESRKDAVLEDDGLQADDNQVKEDESVVAKEDKEPAVATDASVEVDWANTNEANPQKSMLHEETEVLDELLGKANMDNNSIPSTDENYAEKTGGYNIFSEDGVPVENGLATAYEHDLLWGWKALQQLMTGLGFKVDTT